MASKVNLHSLIEPFLIYIRSIYIKILEEAFRNYFIPAITGESAVSDIFRQLILPPIRMAGMTATKH